MTVRDVYKSNAPDTAYSEFKIQREQRHGKNSGSAYDPDSGYSPVSRWLAKAFTYDDFVSHPTGSTGHVAQLQIPRGTIALRCVARVDTLFADTGADAIDIGDGNDLDGWGVELDFSSTGVKYDPDAVYNPDGSTGFAYYENGDTIEVHFKNATAPTAGQAIVFVEVISYHEDLNEEW